MAFMFLLTSNVLYRYHRRRPQESLSGTEHHQPEVQQGTMCVTHGTPVGPPRSAFTTDYQTTHNQHFQSGTGSAFLRSPLTPPPQARRSPILWPSDSSGRDSQRRQADHTLGGLGGYLSGIMVMEDLPWSPTNAGGRQIEDSMLGGPADKMAGDLNSMHQKLKKREREEAESECVDSFP